MNRFVFVGLAVAALVLGALYHRARTENQQLRLALEAARESWKAENAPPAVFEAAPASIAGQPAAAGLEPSRYTPEPPAAHAIPPATGMARPPPPGDPTADMERFDMAMDREFDRLEQRERTSADPTETGTIQRIKEQLNALDELYRQADNAASPEERAFIRDNMQLVMGSIIGLSRVDRDERISRLATDIGYTDPAAVEAFVREVDRIYYETHMDWTKLFNRAPPGDGAPRSGEPPRQE